MQCEIYSAMSIKINLRAATDPSTQSQSKLVITIVSPVLRGAQK